MNRNELTIIGNTSSIAEKIKSTLVELAVNDKLPLDMTQLDSTVFNPIIEPLVKTIVVLHTDAEMALNDEWNRDDNGFENQLILIERVIDIYQPE